MQQGIVLGRFKQSNAFTFGDKLYLRAPSLKFAWFRKSCGKFYIHIHVNTPQNLYYFTLGKPRPLGILRIGCDYVTTVICNLTSYFAFHTLTQNQKKNFEIAARKHQESILSWTASKETLSIAKYI